LARRITTAGLKFSAVIMARTRKIQPCKQEKFTLFCCTSAEFSSPAAAASRRRGNDLGTTFKYLRRTTSSAAGIGLCAPA
jgi:hypothetical protein